MVIFFCCVFTIMQMLQYFQAIQLFISCIRVVYFTLLPCGCLACPIPLVMCRLVLWLGAVNRIWMWLSIPNVVFSITHPSLMASEILQQICEDFCVFSFAKQFALPGIINWWHLSGCQVSILWLCFASNPIYLVVENHVNITTEQWLLFFFQVDE